MVRRDFYNEKSPREIVGKHASFVYNAIYSSKILLITWFQNTNFQKKTSLSLTQYNILRFICNLRLLFYHALLKRYYVVNSRLSIDLTRWTSNVGHGINKIILQLRECQRHKVNKLILKCGDYLRWDGADKIKQGLSVTCLIWTLSSPVFTIEFTFAIPYSFSIVSFQP